MRAKMFFHVFPRNHWYDIVHEILRCFRKAEVPQPVYVGLAGGETEQIELKELARLIGVQVDVQRIPENRFEQPTILALWESAKRGEADVYGYVHSKGITSASPTYTKWRWVMAYWVIIQWRECVRKIQEDQLDSIGCFYLKDWPCFGGNFWWATREWLASLPEPKPSSDRFVFEKWVCKGDRPMKFYSFVGEEVLPYKPETYAQLHSPHRYFLEAMDDNGD